MAGIDPADPVVRAATAQVRVNAVSAKEALSGEVETAVPVIVPGITEQVRLTRGELEELIRPALERTVDILAKVLDDAGLRPADLRAVLLVGGSSRIPLVSELLAGRLSVRVALDAHPKFAVCLGAAIAAGSLLDAAAGSASDQQPPRRRTASRPSVARPYRSPRSAQDWPARTCSTPNRSTPA